MTTRSDDKEAGQDGEATDGKRPAPRVVEVPPELRVAQGARSLVAIVGRPNVGKSTLFNRLVGKHVAIVQDEPGVTRDRHYADAEVRGRPYVLVDTGGFDPEGKDPVVIGIRKQVRAALAEAELAVFVYDATQPLQDADRIAVQLLRESGRPVLWVANKADSPKGDADALALYELGVDRVIPVSALHGRGTMELEGALFDRIPAPREAGLVLDESTSRVAVVGRPNAGKSSLINRLVGQDRLIVDARPGTTTDSIDTLVEKNGRKYVFVDTAGIRRKRAVSAPVEMTSVLQAIRAMERADVVVVLFDATEGALSEQDLRIIGLAVDRGRAVILGMNKFDLLDAAAERKVVAEARERISFASWIPIVKLSAKAGRGTHTLLQMIDRVYDSYRRRVGTGEVNRFFEEVLDKHPPPAQSGRSVRLYYVTQVATRPPRFAAITNHPEYIAPSYDRYLQNQLRERFAFEGVPIRVGYRAKRRREFVDKDDE